LLGLAVDGHDDVGEDRAQQLLALAVGGGGRVEYLAQVSAGTSAPRDLLVGERVRALGRDLGDRALGGADVGQALFPFALEDALQTGAADTWVTKWNLANVKARLGQLDEAVRIIDDVEDAIATWSGYAIVLLWLPGRPATESLLRITDAGVELLIALQRAVIAAKAGDTQELHRVVPACRQSDDPAVVEAANWADSAMASFSTT